MIVILYTIFKVLVSICIVIKIICFIAIIFIKLQFKSIESGYLKSTALVVPNYHKHDNVKWWFH